MCGPTVALLGTVISAYSTYQQGQAAGDAADQNASYLRQQAAREREAGEFQADRLRESKLRLQGKQRTASLANGVALSGSTLDVIEDSAIEAELDIAAARYGSEVNALNFEERARNEQQSGASARTAGIFGALAPVIQGAGRTYIRGAFAA